MAVNAQASLSHTLKVTINSSEVASQTSSGSINLDEYVQYIDTLAPATTKKSYDFGAASDFDFISLEVSGDVIVYFASDGTAIPVKAKSISGGVASGKLTLTSSALAGLFITNEHVTDSVSVKIILGKYSA